MSQYLHPEINRRIAQSEIEGGVWVHQHPDHVNEEIKAQPVLPAGKTLMVQTRNTLYRIEKRAEKEFYVSGHPRYCPTPVRANIHGSTWGGSMLKVGFIGRGMHLEFSIPDHGTITTSQIQEVTEAI